MEAIIAIVAIVGVLWGAAIFLRGGLLAGAMTVLLAGICFGYAFYPGGDPSSGGRLPLTSDRLLWALLMAQLVVWWRWGLTLPRRPGLGEWALAGLAAVLAVSVATHDWHMNHMLPASRFVFFFLMPIGMYYVAWVAQTSERGMKVLFALMALFGVYLALTAVAEKFGVSALVFPRYIASEDYVEFLGRARGPLLNPAANGFLMGTCLIAGLMCWPYVGRAMKGVLVGFAGLMLAGIYCTLTRSAWMGGALGLFTVLLLVIPRVYRPWFVAAAVLGGALLVATQWNNLLEFKRDKYLDARLTATSAELRPVLAAIAWEMFCDRPLLGCGFGHYGDEHVNYLSNRKIDIPLEEGRGYVQHNVFLSVLTETGLVGVIAYGLLLAAWIWNGWRLWQTTTAPLWMRQQGLVFLAAAGNYLLNGLFQDMTIIPMVHMTLFCLAGLTSNLQQQAAEWALHGRLLAARPVS